MSKQRMLKGTAVSSGVAHGRAFVLACTEHAAAPRQAIDAADVAAELARFHAAVARAEAELEALIADVAARIGASEADIFTAQLLVLRDRSFRGQVADAIRDKLINSESALTEVVERFTHTFESIPDAYLRERAADVRDVGRRVLSALIEGTRTTMNIPDGAIVVTDELMPSAAAGLELERVRGFVTERGSRFSHTAILARSLRTPAVTGVANPGAAIATGDRIIVDGVSGVVFLDPDDRVTREYERLEADLRNDAHELHALVDQPARTRDGTDIPLLANVSKFPDTEAAYLYRADGIGLYRTEFSYFIRTTFPTEDEQYEFLARAAARFHPRRVVLRLLDIGGDKQLPYLPLPATRNPSLGRRGIRLLLQHPDLLERQLRAFLRVSADHPISILIPVVGGPEDVHATRAALARARASLAREGKRFAADVPVGAMIEVPSAALLVPALAREADFFSLGTNDLVQYVLAADREDATVGDDYQPLHPAVLHLIRQVADDAATAGRPLTICGEMAGEPDHTALLLGLGLRAFSVAPGELLAVKKAIRDTDLVAARALAAEALTAGSAAEVAALLARHAAARR